MTPLVVFYAGKITDNVGRTFDEIMGMSDAALDAAHDWVQWVFPLDVPSNFNEDAPLIDEEQAAAIRLHPTGTVNIERAYRRFMDYLGLEEQPWFTGPVGPADNFVQRREVVWKEFNHNYLRVTRFLKWLRLMGEGTRSAKVYACLIHLSGRGEIVMSENTRTFWRQTQE